MRKRPNLNNFERRLSKARRLYNEDRVVLVYFARGFYKFKVKGDTDNHDVIYRDGKWMCDCEWNTIHPDNPCSHILASKMLLERLGITVPLRPSPSRPRSEASRGAPSGRRSKPRTSS